LGVQADVAKQLRLSCPELEFEDEFVDPTSGYSIDIRAERRGAGDASVRGSRAGRGWAVEVDGPTHFLQVCDGAYETAWVIDADYFVVCGVETTIDRVVVMGVAERERAGAEREHAAEAQAA
jgi:hypothetical protein